MTRNNINLLLIITSGILSGLSVYHMNFWLIWIALIPLFLVLPTQPIKRSIFYGLLFGLVKGGILLHWIINGTARFSGTETLLGIPLILIIILYYSLFPILFTIVYSKLATKEKNRGNSIVAQILLASFLWISFEWLQMNLFMGIPWVKDTIAFSQLRNLYGIQLASITGQWGISFIIIAVNLLFALAIKNKKISYSIFGFGVLVLFYISGVVIYNLNDNTDGKKIKVAIIQENIQAETRWDESNGDALAKKFFDLNREAASHNPDLIVWSETALPWTFHSDDDLVKIVLEITNKAQATHILGILTESKRHPDKVYNSAYYIEPDGTVSSRYDKVNLLSFIESPLINKDFKVPFLSEGIFSNILKGSSYKPLTSDFGKLGVLICNESLTPYEARKTISNGANILINMSNDAWLENTHLIDQHFYVSRLRAIETRRDMLTNSNRGYGGHISRSGRIIVQNISKDAVCTLSTVTLQQKTSFYFKFRDWFVYTGFIFILFIILFNPKTKRI
jgi:apolipoprotein N-acyltransferase